MKFKTWLYNSIIFPYTYYKVKKIINNMSDIDKAVELAMFEPYDYWFNRLITKMWIKKVSKININNLN